MGRSRRHARSRRSCRAVVGPEADVLAPRAEPETASDLPPDAAMAPGSKRGRAAAAAAAARHATGSPPRGHAFTFRAAHAAHATRPARIPAAAGRRRWHARVDALRLRPASAQAARLHLCPHVKRQRHRREECHADRHARCVRAASPRCGQRALLRGRIRDGGQRPSAAAVGLVPHRSRGA